MAAALAYFGVRQAPRRGATTWPWPLMDAGIIVASAAAGLMEVNAVTGMA